MIPDSQHSERNDKPGSDQNVEKLLYRPKIQKDEHDASGDTRECIDLFAEDERDFIADNIPDYPTKNRRDHAHHDANDGRDTKVQGFLQTQNGEHGDAYRIKQEKGSSEFLYCLPEQNGNGNAYEDHKQVIEVLHP